MGSGQTSGAAKFTGHARFVPLPPVGLPIAEVIALNRLAVRARLIPPDPEGEKMRALARGFPRLLAVHGDPGVVSGLSAMRRNLDSVQIQQRVESGLRIPSLEGL